MAAAVPALVAQPPSLYHVLLVRIWKAKLVPLLLAPARSDGALGRLLPPEERCSPLSVCLAAVAGEAGAMPDCVCCQPGWRAV